MMRRTEFHDESWRKAYSPASPKTRAMGPWLLGWLQMTCPSVKFCLTLAIMASRRVVASVFRQPVSKSMGFPEN